MGCGCGSTATSNIAYLVKDSDGNEVGTFDTRAEASAARPHGGRIYPVRVSS